MEFGTVFFLGCFLPLVVVLDRLLPGRRLKNALLLLAGLGFYAFGQGTGLAVLLVLAVLTWALGRGIARARRKKLLTALAVVLDLGALVLYKYADLFFGSLWGLADRSWEGLGLTVPLGLSFFTFKCISYVLDLSRSPDREAGSLGRVLQYLFFFPQLTAGPITRFSDFAPQLDTRMPDAPALGRGLRRFAVGLSKKVLLAAAAGTVADGVFGLEAAQLSVPLAWLGAGAYTLQIYLDFSGYSDMAIGLGQVFGVETPENFDYPYTAVSVTDFWRRWHISLSSWFRDYLYIPLGGSRRGRGRTAANKLVVFALCGLWHGADWTFLLWGLWHGFLAGLESLTVSPKTLTSPKGSRRVLGRIYTLLAVCLGFVLFRAESLSRAATLFGALFGVCAGGTGAVVTLHSLLTGCNAALLVLGILACTPVVPALLRGREDRFGIQVLSDGLCLGLLGLCALALASGGFTPFIYAQF